MSLVPVASHRTRGAGAFSPDRWSARLLVSVLIPCLAFSTWVPLLSGCRVPPSAEVGNNDLTEAEDGLESESRFAPSPFELRLELPENGRFDLYHSVHSLRGAVGSDAISGSVYAMRTLVVKDLLKTRAALKAMLGGTARARQVTGRADLSFAVPASVKQLYLIGPGSGRVTRPTALASGVGQSASSSPSSTVGDHPSSADPLPSTHGFETEIYFGDIARSIRWIENTEVQPDADYATRRFRLAAGIIYLSANLARLDRHLKFIEEDYWRHPEIRRQFFRAERRCIEQNTFETEGGGTTEESAYLTCRTEWMARHGMDQVKQRILVLKALIAERHNILSVDLGSGEYLYQAVYSRLIAAAGFPDPAASVRPTVLRLPTGEGNRDPIPLSTTFEDEIESRLESLSEPHDRGRLEGLLSGSTQQVGIATLIDRALEKMLLANEDSLDRLCSAIEYRVEWASPLVQLARYPELWEEAKSQFAYLGGLLDFDSAQVAFSNYFRTDQQERTQLRYAAYAGVIGLTVAALFSLGSTLLGAGALSAASGASASAGVAATGTAAASSGFMGLSAGTWMTGVAVASTGLAAYGAYRSHEDSRLSDHLFLGSRRSGSSVIAARDRVLSREDYHLFISAATHLFFRVPWIEAVVAVARPVGNGIVNGAVALAETERGVQVAQWMATQGTRISRLSRVFPGLSTVVRSLGRSLETPLGFAAGTTQTLEQAIQSLSLTTGLARTAIVNRLSRIPLLASILGRGEGGVRLTELADRVFVQSGYLRYLINEEVSDVMVSVPVQLLSSEAPIDYSSMDGFVQSTSRAGVWRNLRISMTEVVAMASIVYLPVMRRAYRSAQAAQAAQAPGSASIPLQGSENAATVPTPDSDQTLPPTIFDSNLDRSARMRHFARNASLFGMVGFSSGFLGTLSTNQRDAYGRERSIRDRVDQAASRGLYEMGFFALSANTQMQLTAYINTRLLSISQRREGRMEELRTLLRDGQLEGERLQVAARELRMLENGRLVLGPAPTAISTTSDATSWWLYVTLLHLTGADQSHLQVPIRGEGDQVNVRAEDSRFGDLSIETIGHAYLRRTDRGDLLAPWQAEEETQDRDAHPVPSIPGQSPP